MTFAKQVENRYGVPTLPKYFYNVSDYELRGIRKVWKQIGREIWQELRDLRNSKEQESLNTASPRRPDEYEIKLEKLTLASRIVAVVIDMTFDRIPPKADTEYFRTDLPIAEEARRYIEINFSPPVDDRPFHHFTYYELVGFNAIWREIASAATKSRDRALDLLDPSMDLEELYLVTIYQTAASIAQRNLESLATWHAIENA